MPKSGRTRKARRKLREERAAMTPPETNPDSQNPAAGGSGGSGELQILDGRKSTNQMVAGLIGRGVISEEALDALIRGGGNLAAMALKRHDGRGYSSAMKVLFAEAKIRQAERHHQDRMNRPGDSPAGTHIHGDVHVNNLLSLDPDGRAEALSAIAESARTKRLALTAGRSDGGTDAAGAGAVSDAEADGGSEPA